MQFLVTGQYRLSPWITDLSESQAENFDLLN